MPVMCDLFCGSGGWTKGFQAHGWHCIGIDLFQQPDYPGEFIQADIAHLLELPEADFYCCSSPCEQFSVHGMKMFHPNPKWPWLGLALFHRAKELIEATGKPYVMENVAAAQKFIGFSVNHCGPFHLWGTGVPAIIPPDCYKAKKGVALGQGAALKGMTREESRIYRKQFKNMQVGGKSKKIKIYTAQWASIPVELSDYIGKIAHNV